MNALLLQLKTLLEKFLASLQKQPVPAPVPAPIPQPVQPAHVSRIADWARAIQKAEGWAVNSVSYTHNNPGNLKFTTLTKSWGAILGTNATDGGHFCKFQTYDQGFQALCNFLTLGAEDQLLAFHSARTLKKFTKVYAQPPNDNYANGIAAALNEKVDENIAIFL